jgi:hypothetical protein
MAKFVDGAGNQHELRVRNVGHLETIQERHGIALDTVFMEDGPGVASLLYSNVRRLGGIIADLCELADDAGKAMVRSLDADAIERARQAMLEALADFCLPRSAGAKFKEQIPEMLSNGLRPSDGLSKATSSAA